MMKGSGFHAIGRRKSATARVYLRPGKGDFLINGKQPLEYIGREVLNIHLREPLTITGLTERYDVIANVSGGGKTGQAGAIRMAVGRALLLAQAETRPPLKAAGVLTRDSREVERKKYGRHKARRRPQYSKR